MVVLDNAPAHNQTEQRVQERQDTVLLRLGPYSRIFNPIEECFSVLKATIKTKLRLHAADLAAPRGFAALTAQRMKFFECVAQDSISAITPPLDNSARSHTAINRGGSVHGEHGVWLLVNFNSF